MRGRALIVLIVVAAVIGLGIASEFSVLSEVSGESHFDGSLILNDTGWRSAPENPNVVYVALLVSEPQLLEALKSSLSTVIRSHNLTPEFVDEPMNYDLKGRLVVVFLPHSFSKNRILYREYGVSGILYYSYAGDAETFTLLTNGKTLSGENLEKLAIKLRVSSIERLNEEHILNQTVSVTYWWKLRVKAGILTERDPYKTIAKQIALELDSFLRSH
ncbi:hypothetical protein [Thermococcus nautili]|uniref:Uncharacterized protein n=1 Tax=Thermococcus nautili TaxID=195522 RepID=W8PIT6_9EURY|nr:hypothetical protein [Thermococcus nautili]AHL22029.1 hypothetical protein BD01_0403 [Thermococcus nautili]